MGKILIIKTIISALKRAKTKSLSLEEDRDKIAKIILEELSKVVYMTEYKSQESFE